MLMTQEKPQAITVNYCKQSMLENFPKQGNGTVMSLNNRLHNIKDSLLEVKSKSLSAVFNTDVFLHNKSNNNVTKNTIFPELLEEKLGVFKLDRLENYIGHMPNYVVEMIENHKSKELDLEELGKFYISKKLFIIAPKTLFINGETILANDPILLVGIWKGNSDRVLSQPNPDFYAVMAQWD